MKLTDFAIVAVLAMSTGGVFTPHVNGQQPATDADRVRVTVSVRDAADGQLIPGSRVSFWRAKGESPALVVTPDKDGGQASILPGVWKIAATADGYEGLTAAEINVRRSLPMRWQVINGQRVGIPGGSEVQAATGSSSIASVSSEAGDVYEVTFALRKATQIPAQFSIVDQVAAPFVALWLSGDSDPTLVLDLAKTDNGKIDLPSGRWTSGAAAYPGKRIAGTVYFSGGFSGTSKDNFAEFSSASAGDDLKVEFSERTGEFPGPPTKDPAVVEVQVWDRSASGHRRPRPDAIVMAWQTGDPGSLNCWASSDQTLSARLASGAWQVAVLVPGHKKIPQTTITSNDPDCDYQTVWAPEPGSGQVHLSLQKDHSYFIDFEFAEPAGTSEPTQQQMTPLVRRNPISPAVKKVVSHGMGATIHGHVFAEKADGTPLGLVEGARIEIAEAEGVVQGARDTDAGGYYAFDGVRPGTLRATISGPDIKTSTRDVQLHKDTGIHVLDFVVVHGQQAITADTGTAEISVFEKSADGKHRRTDASVVLWKGSEKKVLDGADALTGLYETELSVGVWKTMATATGLGDEAEQEITIQPGSVTEHEFVLKPGSTDDSGLSAIVSVRRQWPGQAVAAPTVTFGNSSPVTATRMTARELDTGATNDLSGSHWDWFRAKPAAAVPTDVVRVAATLPDYDGNSVSATWTEDSTETVFLSLKPRVSDQPPPVQLTGNVFLKVGDQPQQLLSESHVLLTPRDGGEPLRANAASGRYQVSLPVGQWSAVVYDAQQNIVATSEVFLGATPTQNHDFLIRREDANQPLFPPTDVYVLVEVTDSTNVNMPTVEMWTTRHGPIMGPDGTAAPTGTAVYHDAIEVRVERQSWRSPDGASWYIARPVKPIAAGRSISATASVSDGGPTPAANGPANEWVRAPERASAVVAAGKPTQLQLTLRRRHHTPRPGILAGCVQYAQAQYEPYRIHSGIIPDRPEENVRPVPEREERPPAAAPVRNATIIARSMETGELESADAPNGCFEMALPAGTWTVSVLIPGREAWPVPDSVVLREGETTRRDIILPAEQSKPNCGELVQVYAAVRSASAGVNAPIPVLELKQQVVEQTPETFTFEKDGRMVTGTRLVPKTKTVNTIPCSVRPLSPAEVQSQGLNAEMEGTWTWYLGQPTEHVEPGTYIGTGRITGCDLVFPVGPNLPAKQISPGATSVFDLIFEPWSPTVNIVVLGTDGSPRPGIDVRLMNTELEQTFAEGLAVKTDAAGHATAVLAAGPGQYKVFLSGAGISPQGSQEEIRERATDLSYRIFAAGETKTYPLAGVVKGVKNKYETQIRKLPTDKAAMETVAVPQPVEIENGTVQLHSLDGQAILPELQKSLPIASDGRFHWDAVPEGRYEVVASAPDFVASRQQVQIADNHANIEITLTRRNVDFENAIRILLTDGWGISPTQRQAAQKAWQEARAADPGNPLADFAMALVMLNRRDNRECLDLLKTLELTPPQPSDPPQRQMVVDRCLELRVWLEILLRRRSDVAASVPRFARTFCGTGPATSTCKDCAYIMGISSGYFQGPGSRRGVSWDAGFDRMMQDILFAAYEPEYIRGRDAVLGRYRKLDEDMNTETARNAEEFEAKRAAALRKVTAQLEKIQGELQTLQKEHNNLKTKAEARLTEILEELKLRIPRRDVYLRDAQQIDANLKRWRAELNQLLQQRKLPANGGFGGGGLPNGVGGFPFQGAHHQPLPPDVSSDLASRPRYILTVNQDDFPSAEREQQLRQLIFQAEPQLQRKVAEYTTENDRVIALQADEKAVRDAWNQTFRRLDGPYRQQEAQRNQLRIQKADLENASVGTADYLRGMEADLRSPEAYFSYPLEERRQEVLGLSGRAPNMPRATLR